MHSEARFPRESPLPPPAILTRFGVRTPSALPLGRLVETGPGELCAGLPARANDFGRLWRNAPRGHEWMLRDSPLRLAGARLCRSMDGAEKALARFKARWVASDRPAQLMADDLKVRLIGGENYSLTRPEYGLLAFSAPGTALRVTGPLQPDLKFTAQFGSRKVQWDAAVRGPASPRAAVFHPPAARRANLGWTPVSAKFLLAYDLRKGCAHRVLRIKTAPPKQARLIRASAARPRSPVRSPNP